LSKSEFINFKNILLFALVNSVFFGLGSIVKIQSLKYIPSSFAFPVTKLNAVFLIIYALFLFDEKPTFYQWTGILISLSMLAYISLSIKNDTLKTKADKKQIIGFLFALLAAFSTSISMLTGKYASTEVPKINYIFISYFLVFIYTTIINKLFYKVSEEETKISKKKTIFFGVIIGFLNLAGYYLVLSAFETGPLSLIQGISSNSFIIPVILSVLFLNEKFRLKNAVVIILSIISILLIKLEF